MAVADGQTQTGAAEATANSPLSSQSQSQSQSADQGAQADASTKTLASQDGTTQAQTQTSTPARPDWLPSDEFWDGEKNEIKPDLGKKFNEMATRIAADDVTKSAFEAAIPTPESYKSELPVDFKPPPGVEFKLDASDPALVQFKQFAHKYRLPQEAFSEALAVYAGKEVGLEASIAAARAAEVAALGAAGPSRVDNLMRVMDANGLGVLKSSIVTAKQVEAFEAHFAKLATQGSASFSQSHRVPPDTKSIPGYEGMSFEQRRFAQDQRARKTG